MTDLHALESTFVELASRADPLADDPGARLRSERLAKSGLTRSPVAQIEAYREQYWLRHVGSLREDYPTLEALLGAEGFERLARAYLIAYPPRHWALRDASADVASFVRGASPWKEDPVLADCAAVEWACIAAHDAEDGGLLDPRSLALVPDHAWPLVRVHVQPALQIVELTSAAHVFREAVRGGIEPRPARPEIGRRTVAFFRANDAVAWREIEAAAGALLVELARGTPLGAACERAAAVSGESESAFEEKIGGFFQAWTAEAWLTRVELPDGS